MPNWCSTRINFYGDKAALSDFHDKIEKYTSSSVKKSDFGNNWLGNIVLGFGLTYDGDSGVCCRGSLDFLDEANENGEFNIDTETAWVPMLRMWEKIIEKHYSDSNGDPLIFFDWLWAAACTAQTISMRLQKSIAAISVSMTNTKPFILITKKTLSKLQMSFLKNILCRV